MSSSNRESLYRPMHLRSVQLRPAAVQAAVEMQRQLSLPVRIGFHTGEAELRH